MTSRPPLLTHSWALGWLLNSLVALQSLFDGLQGSQRAMAGDCLWSVTIFKILREIIVFIKLDLIIDTLLFCLFTPLVSRFIKNNILQKNCFICVEIPQFICLLDLGVGNKNCRSDSLTKLAWQFFCTWYQRKRLKLVDDWGQVLTQTTAHKEFSWKDGLYWSFYCENWKECLKHQHNVFDTWGLF